MDNTKDLNEITVIGEITQIEPEFESFGSKFNQICLAVSRLSGTVDIVPVVYKDIPNVKFELHDRVKVVGSIRTRNVMVDGKSRLIMYVYGAPEAVTPEMTDFNMFVINGYICKPVNKRETPMGRRVADMVVAHNTITKKSYYLPSILFNGEADRAENLKVGDNIIIRGRFQSRLYNKTLDDGTNITKIAYELAISNFDMVENQE